MNNLIKILFALSATSQAFTNSHPFMIQAGASPGYLSSRDTTYQANQIDLTVSTWDTSSHWSSAIFLSFTEPQSPSDYPSPVINPSQYIDIGYMRQWNRISDYTYLNLGAGLGIHYAEEVNYSGNSCGGDCILGDSWLFSGGPKKSIGLTAPLRAQIGLRWKVIGVGASTNAVLRYTPGIPMNATLETGYGIRFTLFIPRW